MLHKISIANQVNKNKKHILTYLCFWFLSNNAFFGQNWSNWINPQNKHMDEFSEIEFSRHVFTENHLKQISAYVYFANSKGKIPKKGILIFKQEFDSLKNIISGKKSTTGINFHSPFFKPNYYNFEIYYNKNGQILKELVIPLNKQTKTSQASTCTEYQYDSLGNEIKETSQQIDKNYSVSNKKTQFPCTTTTILSKSTQYYYNLENQKIKEAHSTDSTIKWQVCNWDTITLTSKCENCFTDQLAKQWSYNSNKQLALQITYTNKNSIHSKQNYFYDKDQRIIKQIDSTGWYLPNTQPYVTSIITYMYSDSGTTKKVTYYKDQSLFVQYTITYFFNNANELITQCLYNESGVKCTQYKYVYKNNKLHQLIQIDSHGVTTQRQYTYNSLGYLKEDKEFINNKLKKVIRYSFD